MRECDIAVIGGGPAGYIAAIKAARLGSDVVLMEQHQLGGTCLNRGCIPTKTLIDTAKMIDRISEGQKRGLNFSGSFQIDMKKVAQYKTRMIRRMAAGIGVLLRENGVETFTGTGTSFPDLTVRLDGERVFKAKKIIVATGTSPLRLPIPGMDDPRVLTTDGILDLEYLPSRLAILGAGVAGVEFAWIFKMFGCDVHVIETLEKPCAFLDPELSETLEKSLIDRKIRFSFGTKLVKIEARDNFLRLHLDDGQIVESSHLLVAAGRSPDCRAVEKLDLDKKRTYVSVNRWMQTSHPDVYAPGDLNGLCMLAHAAYRMGETAADHAVGSIHGDKAPEIPEFCSEQVPAGIYGGLELGFIGLTEEKAKEKHGEILVGRFSLAASGRAVTAGHPEGFLKVIADAKTDKIVGVHIIGLSASELVNEAAVAVTLGLTITQWKEVIHAHPTVSESLVEAAADAKSLSLHIPPKRN